MSTQAALTAFYDQQRRRTTDAIRNSGSWLTYVSDDSDCDCCAGRERAPSTAASFCYTTGLFGIGHPELLVYGLDPVAASDLLNLLVHGVAVHDQDLTPGQQLVIDELGLTVMVEEVPDPGEVVLWANDYWQRAAEASVPVLQLIWADAAGRFPWQPGCSDAAKRQPRPGRHPG